MRMDIEPPRRRGLPEMLANLVIHIIAGVIGVHLFLLNARGITYAMFFSAIIQGMDSLAMYFNYRKLIQHMYHSMTTSAPTDELRNYAKGSGVRTLRVLPYKIAQTFVLKVLWYCAVTVATSLVIRKLL